MSYTVSMMTNCISSPTCGSTRLARQVLKDRLLPLRWLVMLAFVMTAAAQPHIVVAGLSDEILSQQPQATLKWQRINNMPVGVFSAAVSTQETTRADGSSRAVAVVTGGLNQAGQASDIVQVLDLESLTWGAPLRLPEGTSYHAQVTLADGRIFVAGGKTGSLLDKLHTTARTWVIAADFSSVTPGPELPAAAANLTGHLLPDGRVLLVAGRSALLYDAAANTWAAQIPLRETRTEHASVLLRDGRVMIAGGVGRRSMEVVDVANRISTMLATKFSDPRDDLAAAMLPDGRVLLIGGQHSHTGLTVDENLAVDLSNPQKATATTIDAMGVKRGWADMAVTMLGPWVFALGGETQTSSGDIELTTARVIDSRSLKVWALPDMAVEHDDAVAVSHRNAVIIIGGYSVKEVKLGPLESRMPTAVHVVERLVMPSSDSSTPSTPPSAAAAPATVD